VETTETLNQIDVEFKPFIFGAYQFNLSFILLSSSQIQILFLYQNIFMSLLDGTSSHHISLF